LCRSPPRSIVVVVTTAIRMSTHPRSGRPAPPADDTAIAPYPTLQSASVLWRPNDDVSGVGEDAYPIFITQRTLAALEGHVHSASEQGVLGFLMGRLVECPQTSVRYLLIHGGARVRQSITADEWDNVLPRSWDAAQRMLHAEDGELVGWYHTHPGGDVALSASDRSAHARHFPQPWHVALVVATGAPEMAAAFWRVPADASALAARLAPLPFYELLDASAVRGGWKRAQVSWSNYSSPDPAVWPAAATVPPDVRKDVALPPGPGRPTRRTAASAAAAVPPRRVAMPPVILPARFEEEEEERPPWQRQVRRTRGLRAGLRVGGAVVLAAAAFAAWMLLGPAPASEPAVPQPAVPQPAATPVMPDDSLRLALNAYQGLAARFVAHQATCEDLGGGMAAVDARWIAYNLARRGTGVRPDSAEAALDQALADAVDQTEANFERTGCPRP
jgi:proteasome lid subunit RPN8/RPN11